jgi:dihydrofolate synthase/folylpolyglutamate synthase
VENAATAAVALTRFALSDREIEAGIARAEWPGRIERLSERPEIVVDGAHNPAGARALAAYIERFYAGRKIRLIYGAMRDKAVDEIAGILFPLAEEVIVTAPQQSRALAPDAILEAASHPNLRTAPDLRGALDLVRDAAGDEAIFITGSLFLVAEARAVLLV